MNTGAHISTLLRVHGRTNRGSRGERWRPRAPRAAREKLARLSRSIRTTARLLGHFVAVENALKNWEALQNAAR